MTNIAFYLKQNIYSHMIGIVNFQNDPQMDTLTGNVHGDTSMIPTREIGNISNALNFYALQFYLNSFFSHFHSNIYTAFTVIHSNFAYCKAAMRALNNE